MATKFKPSTSDDGPKLTAQEKLAQLEVEKKNEPADPRTQVDQRKKIHVKLISAFDTHFEDDALSFTATNNTGPFDILPGHANFMCLLLPGEVVINTGSEERVFTIGQGLLQVHDESVVAFLNI